MKYLIDSNVLLEAALKRQYWTEAADFLAKAPPLELAVCDFSLHALGFYLIKKTPDTFDRIVADIVARSVAVLRLDPTQLALVSAASRQFRLDFDDAFVYTVAELNDLVIVSFDADFDRTSRGRRRPSELLTTP